MDDNVYIYKLQITTNFFVFATHVNCTHINQRQIPSIEKYNVVWLDTELYTYILTMTHRGEIISSHCSGGAFFI